MSQNRKSSFELYLCEKPSQGRDIARVLKVTQRHDGYLQGNGLLVSWCIGHLLEMVPPDSYDPRYKRWSLADLPILPRDWQFQPKPSTRKQLTILRKLLKQCHSVVIATDADREGETIAREVLQFLKFKGTTRRLWLSALDTVSIQRALKNIRTSQETEPLYRSGLARSRADWLIGMNLTRAFTLLANDRQVRSVGRVQTPTLALVVKRDREIHDFKPQPYYEVQALFQTAVADAPLLETRWQPPKPLLDENRRCLDRQQAEAVIARCQDQYGVVTQASTERKTQPPPLLYNLSALQQEASRRWGYGAQEVLNLAQSLYETHKLTTYPRSDCEYLPLSQFQDVPAVLQTLANNDPALAPLIAQADQGRRSRAWNDQKITAHHAIIPTQATADMSRLNNRERNLYDLIRRRYLAQFFPDFEYDQSIIMVAIDQDRFKASGRISMVKGWKQILETDSDEQNLNNNGSSAAQDSDKELPAVSQGEQLLCQQLKLLDKLTKPPRHYTEGTLIKAMETIGSLVTDKVMKKILRDTAGLGTQATRANIIQTLLQRQFIQKERKLLKATPLGFALIDTLPESIKDPVLTAQWEQQLEDLANNREQNINVFLQQQIALLSNIINKIKHPKESTLAKQSPASEKRYSPGSPCPVCGHALEIRQAVRGSKIGQDYIGCSDYPRCRFFSWCH